MVVLANISVLFLQYITFSVLLVMIACAVFLQLGTLHKFILLSFMACVYLVLIWIPYKQPFEDYTRMKYCR